METCFWVALCKVQDPALIPITDLWVCPDITSLHLAAVLMTKQLRHRLFSVILHVLMHFHHSGFDIVIMCRKLKTPGCPDRDTSVDIQLALYFKPPPNVCPVCLKSICQWAQHKLWYRSFCLIIFLEKCDFYFSYNKQQRKASPQLRSITGLISFSACIDFRNVSHLIVINLNVWWRLNVQQIKAMNSKFR